MKIIVNALSAGSGGAKSYIRYLLPKLVRRVHESDEHTITLLFYKEQLELLGGEALPSWCTEVVPSHTSTLSRIAWASLSLPRYLEESGADVCFTPYQVNWRAFRHQHTRCKDVLMIRNMEPFHFRRYQYSPKTWGRNMLLKKLSDISLKRAERVIAVSQFAEDYLSHTLGLGPDRMKKVYHGRHPGFSAAGDEHADQSLCEALGVWRPFILMCGSLLPYRRCEDLLEAYKRFHERWNVDLVIAGTGTDSQYRAQLEALRLRSGVAHRIHFVGHVNRETIQALYRRTKVCVFTTEIEACPNVAIEAMSSGCVNVSSACPPLPEIFAGASVFYKPRDIDDLGRQVERALHDDALRRELRNRALARAEEFSWERCADETFYALTSW